MEVVTQNGIVGQHPVAGREPALEPCKDGIHIGPENKLLDLRGFPGPGNAGRQRHNSAGAPKHLAEMVFLPNPLRQGHDPGRGQRGKKKKRVVHMLPVIEVGAGFPLHDHDHRDSDEKDQGRNPPGALAEKENRKGGQGQQPEVEASADVDLPDLPGGSAQ